MSLDSFNSDFDDDWLDEDSERRADRIIDQLSFKKGQADARAGLDMEDNPFDAGTTEAFSWDEGFLDGGR